MYVVYVLKSLTVNKSYVGITDNLDERLSQHNLGESFYTKRYMPWNVIYTEKFNNREEARKREKYLKSCAGRKFLKNLFKKTYH